METFVLEEETKRKGSNVDAWARVQLGQQFVGFFACLLLDPQNWHKESLGKHFKLFDCEV